MQLIDTQRAERAQRASAARAGKNRRKGHGHPTTAEMDYTTRELRFMKSIQEWKLTTGTQYPTWREVLAVIDSLWILTTGSSRPF